ncbi:class I SAM-dependent methyltransferase [Qipengyuania sp. 1NDH17]|uniref:Class I SAM-dependent methyltransferase n=1 Tax=Qipengyuania polymorpha TaxID=2867234 RepID=A0ABS7IUT9_9SPHN|nr:methyltransferase domain-containing protein [Qipengyuania polymorpha]MBX7457192.1 class I SAM-dependent methyltransferase [Qipengyuania polymorpha]
MSTCVTCSGPLRFQRRYVFESDAFRRIYSGREVYRCEACNLSQVDTAKVDDAALTQYYREDYRKVGSAGRLNEATRQWYLKRGEALAELARNHAVESVVSIFEVGAGFGYNLRAFGQRYPGARLETDEISGVANEARAGAIAAGQLGDGRHDVVILSHVLEHFTDPRALLERVWQGLRRGGIVVIEVPNDVDGIERFNGPDEPHLTFFEEPTLRALLGRTRFEIAELFPAGPAYVERSRMRSARQALRWVLYRIPGMGAYLHRRAARNVAALPDFSGENPRGVFLRAVLRKS